MSISKIVKGLRRLAEAGTLFNALVRLRPALANAAQKALDAWSQNEDGFDEEHGHGGICDEIAQYMSQILDIPGVEVTDGGHDGDDHAWLIAYTDQEAYGIDIPPSIYETGSNYNWRKKPGAKIRPNDVEIFKLNRADIAD